MDSKITSINHLNTVASLKEESMAVSQPLPSAQEFISAVVEKHSVEAAPAKEALNKPEEIKDTTDLSHRIIAQSVPQKSESCSGSSTDTETSSSDSENEGLAPSSAKKIAIDLSSSVAAPSAETSKIEKEETVNITEK